VIKNKSVLIIGEDMLMLYASSGGKAKHVGSLLWTEENIVERLTGMLLREGKRRPVHILYDMLEQQYKKEMIPQLSILDKQRYINRKLKVVFPSNPMRAAYFLKGEAEDNLKEQRRSEKGNPYIFASVPDLPQLRYVYEALKDAQLPIIGFGLLPVEGASMLKRVSDTFRSGPHKAKWAVMLSVHESGGLRQIVIKNGELALTRLTAISANFADETSWGSEVGQEFKSTLSYLLRFGYTQDQGIDIYLVHGGDAAATAFRKELNIDVNLVCKSVDNIAKACGLRIAGNHGNGYGDGLHAAWASKIAGMRLPINSVAFGRLIAMRRTAKQATNALLLAILAGGLYAGYLTQDTARASLKVGSEQRHHATLQAEVSKREESLVKIDQDTDTILRILDIHESLEKRGVQSFALVNAISQALPNDVKLSAFSISATTPEGEGEDDFGASELEMMENPDAGADAGYVKPVIVAVDYEIVMDLEFPATINPEDGVKTVNAFKDNLVQSLGGYTVEITQQVANLSREADFSEDLKAMIAEVTRVSGMPDAGGLGDDMMGNAAEGASSSGAEGMGGMTARITIKGTGQ